MKCSLTHIPSLAAGLRRTATLAGLSLLGLAAALPGARAQSPNDVAVPTPFSWPMFHSGGTSPGTFSPSGFNPSPNLLTGQLQGLPSGVYTNTTTGVTMLTETPSFLLGNYRPTLPPGSQTAFFPNNFRDAIPFSVLSWSSPFTFLIPAGALDDPNALQVDDTTPGTPPTPNPNVTLTPSRAAWQNAGADFVDGTATNTEYLLHGVVQTPAAASAGAKWTLTAPAAGFYAITFHIPDVPLDNTQVRVHDAHYRVVSNAQQLADVRVSQTDANASQNLAGPFFLAAGQTVTVTLDNTTAEDPANKVVVADSLSLQPGFGADTQGQPTAVNATQYPEIRDALYYGVLPASDPARTPPSATYNGDPSLPDPAPRGNPTEGTLNPDPSRRIRQLVYFGRTENIIQQDSYGNLVNDNGTAPSSPVIRSVGAIYCVDGFTGSVVWRYQTPTVTKTNPDGSTIILPSAPVFTTPAVARINVVTKIASGGVGNPALVYYGTKLVVIVADDNGLVYCLDALGNRNGTSNSSAVSVNGQPIFNPKAGLNDVPSPPKPHVGTTPVYWVYRPDPASIIRDGVSHFVTTADPAVPARDLPVPLAFGLASPTIYVNPNANVSGTPPGLPPSNPGVAGGTLKSNATVYLGNSNGTLYALDALGGVGDGDTTDTKGQSLFNFPRRIGELGPINGGTSDLTCSVKWWFAVNGTATNTNDDNNAAIVSAPAVWETDGAQATSATTQQTTITPPDPPTTPGKVQHIYFTTANDPLNEGRLYSITSDGPVDQTTRTTYYSPAFAANKVGAVDYNVNAEPDWAFPQLDHQVQVLPTPVVAGKTRAPLGSMSGSPAVFLNPHDVPAFQLAPAVNAFVTPTIYVAAASGVEEAGQDRPGVEETGRLWAVDAVSGAMRWAFPNANDPNTTDFAYNPNDTSPTPATSPPVGTFRHVTPAIGMVQFPSKIVFGAGTGAGATYTHTDSQGTFTADGSANGPIVAMLYAGSAGTGAGQLGPRFFGLDLDAAISAKTINEVQATIFKDVLPTPVNANGPDDPANYVPGIASPGDAFQTSPALVVNSSTTGGNGGVLFTAAGSTLYQMDATPETSQDTASTQPLVNILALDAGYGPITPPSVAGADVSDLETITPPATAVPQTTDWVYFGDRGLGITFGITPLNQGNGVGTALGGVTPPDGGVRPRFPLPQFPLYSYLFDGTTAHPGGKDVPTGATTSQASDMGKANDVGGVLPVFEWGNNVYIRIGNVVPPYPVLDSAGKLNQYSIPDPDDPIIVFADGGPVSIQVSEFDPASRQANQTDTGQVPATVLTDLPGNGFIRRTDAYKNGHFIAGPPSHDSERLTDVNGDGWIGAYTYAVRDGSGRKNTPGSTRRVINALQTAKAYRLVTTTDPVSNVTTTTPQFFQTVTLQTTITQGGQYTRNVTLDAGGGVESGKLGNIGRVDQPTFALLNPLALHGGGVPLFGSQVGKPTQIGEVVGPFAGVHAAGSATDDDLPAYTNGNRTYRLTTDIPKSGVLGAGQGNPRLRYRQVTTAAGEINHGTAGDNAAPGAPAAPKGSLGQGTGGLVDVNAFGGYMLDIADRSTLGLNGQHLQVTMEAHNGHWNDNSGAGGPGAVVNPLPWERMPAQYGPNSTPDYPNFPRSAVTHVVQPFNPNNAAGIGGPATSQAVVPDPATANGADASTRYVYADPVQVRIAVPRFQPANLQLYDQTAGFGSNYITPQNAVQAHDTYPMGYVSRRQRVYVDSNHNGRYDDGEAYRYLYTYLGVPVDMHTTIETSTVDLGKLPQSLGVQTNLYSGSGLYPDQRDALGTFMPYTLPGTSNYPARFRSFFKPLDIRNRGNVNLLNVHLDQKIVAPPTITGNTLPLVSDALDSQALIPAFDSSGVTGPRPNGVQPFLLRSSLDTDLVAAFGRNPGIVNNYNALYPSATFHKAQVGAGQPSQLTVPDVPNNNVAGSPYALYPNPTSVPLKVNSAGNQLVADFTNSTTGTTSQVPATSVPFIGLAVPLGTPVGTYSQRVQLFEGLDQSGYRNIGQGVTYTPLMPPKYGGTEITAGGTTVPGTVDDTWYANVVRTGSTPTVVKGTVTETRVTDGASFGTVPQVDPFKADTPTAGPNARGVADFQPSAFRNVFWNGSSVMGDGSLGLVWTTSRGFTNASTPPYNIAGSLLSFQGGYFNASPTGSNDPATRWWRMPSVSTEPHGLLFTNTVAAPNGVSTGMTFAPDQQLPDGAGKFRSDGSVYAFVQNTVAGAGSQSQILCYPVTGGVVNTTTPTLVTRDPGPAKSGVRGLKFSGTTFTDPFKAPGTISNNLWAFWAGGARNRSTISYGSADTTVTATGGLTFGKSALLPIPAGLVSVSDPSAVLIYVPKGTTDTPTPAIEVTYTGIAPDGNADIYVSRYQPYYVRDARNQPTAQVGLALVPSPLISEQLQADPGNLYWQARDVAWLRDDVPLGAPNSVYRGVLNVFVNNTPLLRPVPATPGTTTDTFTNIRETYDRQSGTLVYTNVAVPTPNATTVNSTVYVDLARGRVRFSPALGSNAYVYAAFYAQARRITTDTRADTTPLVFLDPTYKANEAPSSGRVQTDRYWFIWRKSGSSGTSTTPTLYYKTQRLTVDLHDANNQPVSIRLLNTNTSGTGPPVYKPDVTVTVGGQPLYPAANGGPDFADVDWARGRIYFPMVAGGKTTEGQTATVTFSYVDKAGTTQTSTITDVIHWLDEPRTNDLQNRPTATGPLSAAATSETALPIDTIVNESNVSAFLDPVAFGNVAGGAYDLSGNLGANANQPHKIWLFWNSTRNGTADIYYETIEPKFSASP